MNVGDRRNRLVLLERIPGAKYSTGRFQCDCGVIKPIRIAHVRNGITVSCGCIKRKHEASPGQVFGRLTVLDAGVIRAGERRKVLCRCSCGNVKRIGIDALASGSTKSCGCLIVEQLRSMSLKHGGEGTALYSVWQGMKNRCYRSGTVGFHRYGGRGIRVCQEWVNDFAAFRDWAIAHGHAPGLEIDRQDVNGNYEPTNCRWVTPLVQGNNRSTNVVLTVFGESETMKNWSRDKRCVVSYATLKQRIKAGWNAERALTTLVAK